MRDGKIAVEFDLKKIGAVAVMVAATWLGLKCGEWATLLTVVSVKKEYIAGKGARE